MFDNNLFIEPQKYNFKLKKNAKSASISKVISNKVARVRFGTKRPVLSKMPGHTNESTSNNHV
jgi:hypothetical protein